MSKADEYLKQIDTLDKLKQSAIDELKGIIADAEEKLAKLGVSSTKTRKTGTRTCKVCGQTGHNSRFHAKDGKGKK
jgi:hypothetical protein